MTEITHIATNYLLPANLVAHLVLIIAVIWCVACPTKRIYPMPRKTSAYYLMWLLFGYVFLSNPLFIVTSWNTGVWASPLRFWIAVPMVFIGVAFLTWGIRTLGTKNTSGLHDGFVAKGPYLVSRNPQYVGDFFIFTGVIIFANSGEVLATHLLTILVFAIAPVAEEPWLHEQYGEKYDDYRTRVPRFL